MIKHVLSCDAETCRDECPASHAVARGGYLIVDTKAAIKFAQLTESDIQSTVEGDDVDVVVSHGCSRACLQTCLEGWSDRRFQETRARFPAGSAGSAGSAVPLDMLGDPDAMTAVEREAASDATGPVW